MTVMSILTFTSLAQLIIQIYKFSPPTRLVQAAARVLHSLEILSVLTEDFRGFYHIVKLFLKLGGK